LCRDEAQIERTRRIDGAGRPIWRAGRTQVDFLITEFQRKTSVASESLTLHSEGALVPGRYRRDIATIQDDVIDALD
jgi:hypothetical protein